MYANGLYGLRVAKTGPSKSANLYWKVYHTSNEIHYFHGIYCHIQKRLKFYQTAKILSNSRILLYNNWNLAFQASIWWCQKYQYRYNNLHYHNERQKVVFA